MSQSTDLECESLLRVNGVGWHHLWVYAFLILMQISIVGICAGFNASCNQWYQIVFDVDYYDYLDDYIIPIYTYWWIPTLPVYFAVGVCADKFGRWWTLVGCTVASLALSPLLWYPSGPPMYSAGWVVVKDLGVGCMSMLVLLYLYESIARKWRGIALVGFSMVHSFGEIMISLITSSGDYMEMTDTDNGMPNWWRVVSAAPFCLLAVSLLLGLVAVNRDTQFSIAMRACSNCEEIPSLWGVLKSVWTNLAVCTIAFVGYIYTDQIPLNAYFYVFQAYIGESYQFNMMRGEILTHVCVMFGVLIAVAVWTRTGIKLAPTVCLTACAVAAGILSSVYLYDGQWVKDMSEFSTGQVVTMGVGLGLAYMAIGVLYAILNFLVLEMFPSKFRGRGIAIYTILMVIMNNSARIVRQYHRQDPNLMYILCGVFAGLAIIVGYGFMKTDWFNKSDIAKRATIDDDASEDTIKLHCHERSECVRV